MPRWAGVNVSARIAWAAGCSPPPVRPWMARNRISSPSEGARPQKKELMPKPRMQAR